MLRKHVIFHYHMVIYEMDVSEMLSRDNSLIIYPRINIFVMFFPFSFFILLEPIGNFCGNVSCQIYFTLTMGTKIVTS